MAMTSLRLLDHEGIVEPYLLGNRAVEIVQPNHDTTTVNVEVDLKDYLPMYQAALNGDWESATWFMAHYSNAVTARVSIQSMTALHVAARAGHSDFIEKLVAHELMSQGALAIQDFCGRTALHYAAMNATKKANEAMVNKNPALTQITDNNGWTPLFCAASWGKNNDVVWYLCSKTTDHPPASPFTGPLAAPLICTLTRAGFYDVAIDLVRRYPNLATAKDAGKYSVLRVLAETPSAFQSGSKLGFWRSLAHQSVTVQDEVKLPGDKRPISIPFRSTVGTILARAYGVKQIHDEKLRHEEAKRLVKLVCKEVSWMNNLQIVEFFKESAILTTATSHGIEEIVRLCCLQYFPDLIWLTISQKTMLHVAVEHRQKRIFSLLKGIAGISGIVDSRTNILHVVAKLPPNQFRLKSVAGSALQMQSELQWFKDVNEIVPPSYKEERNAMNQTALDVFMEEHTVLAKDAEKWTKETANYCMVVATLVTTVVFAAAFTVPGGTHNEKGIPIFLKHKSFLMFAITDARALVLSSTSILMFLPILVSRTTATDFLWSLPTMLINAIVYLFLSITAMIIAFASALWIILGERLKLKLIPIAIVLLSLGPILEFSWSQFPLFWDVVYSNHKIAESMRLGIINRIVYCIMNRWNKLPVDS